MYNVAPTHDLCVPLYHTPHTFPASTVKIVYPWCHTTPPRHFYIVFWYCWTYHRHDYAGYICHWMLSKQQSVSYQCPYINIGTVVIVWELDLQLHMQLVHIPTKVVSSTGCTRYIIMWYSLLMTCGRSVVFSGYSSFLHQ